MRDFRILFLIILFCSTTNLFSKDIITLKGKVFVKIDGEKQPLEGANIYCLGTTIGTTSENNGTFEINLDKGEYNFIVSFVGYAPVIEKMKLSKNREKGEVEFILEKKDILGLK